MHRVLSYLARHEDIMSINLEMFQKRRPVSVKARLHVRFLMPFLSHFSFFVALELSNIASVNWRRFLLDLSPRYRSGFEMLET